MKAVCISFVLGMAVFGSARSGELFQYSTTDALLAGVLDGENTVGEMLEKGNFGLGIFNGLDGEMVVLDGEAFRLSADQTAEKVDSDTELPFYCVCDFKENEAESFNITATEYAAFNAELDSKLPTLNYPYAIKMEGTFRRVVARSMRKEKAPYAPISEILERRVIFELEDVGGFIVGFRCPVYLAGINTAGYHFHFITEDRSAGGHVMDFELDTVSVQVMRLSELDIFLPDSEAFEEVDFSIDRSQVLEDAHRLEHEE